MASIEFSRGVKEVPTNVRLLKSKSSNRSSAIFRFEKDDLISDAQEIMGMVMSDEEGEITCRKIQGKFVNGEFRAIEAIYEMETEAEWDRFMRFMERFSASNEMEMGGGSQSSSASDAAEA